MGHVFVLIAEYFNYSDSSHSVLGVFTNELDAKKAVEALQETDIAKQYDEIHIQEVPFGRSVTSYAEVYVGQFTVIKLIKDPSEKAIWR